MLAFQNGVPIFLTKDGRRFVVCNGDLGEEEYPGSMIGDLVYGGRTTTGCGAIIDITDSPDCHPSCGCGEGRHGALPAGATVAERRPPHTES